MSNEVRHLMQLERKTPRSAPNDKQQRFLSCRTERSEVDISNASVLRFLSSLEMTPGEGCSVATWRKIKHPNDH